MGAMWGTRRSGGGRRRRGFDPKLVAGAAALGIAGLGFVLVRSRGDGAPIVALNAPAAPGALGAAGPEGTEGASAPAAAVPPGLAAALERATDPDPLVLVDLRKLAKDHAGTPEATRAVEVLAVEAARARAAAVEHEVAGRLEDALREATRGYLATLERGPRQAQRAALLALSERVHAGSTPPSTVTVYTVEKGDSLSRVGTKSHTDHRMIQRLSRLPNDRLRVGQRLRVPAAPTTVVVFKKDFELVALLGPNALEVHDVATGKDGCTPESDFRIGTKQVNPDWYSPDGKVHRFGSKENILGTRWMAFENTEQHHGFGIHGTSFPDSIGTEASMGCVRMRNEDVERLYDIVPAGSLVRIVK